MNTAALHRLAVYCGIPTSHLLTALPELDHQRAGGAVLAPDRRPLQLTWRRHGTWLVKTDPPLSIHPVPEVRRAAGTLLRQQHQYTPATLKMLYATVRGYLTFDWRGLGWHNHLAKRWAARQQILRPDADHTDLYLLARTEHWSMLPEAVAISTVLANACRSAPLTNLHVYHGVANSLSRALRLDDYWSLGTNADIHPGHSFRHLPQLLAEHPHQQRRTTRNGTSVGTRRISELMPATNPARYRASRRKPCREHGYPSDNLHRAGLLEHSRGRTQAHVKPREVATAFARVVVTVGCRSPHRDALLRMTIRLRDAADHLGALPALS